jgi:hypothetical protein
MHAVADALDQVIAYDRLVAFREADIAEEPAPADVVAVATSDLRLVTLDVHGEEGTSSSTCPPRGKHKRGKDAASDPGEVEVVLESPAGADSSSSRRPWALSLIGGLLFGAGVLAALSYSHFPRPWASATTEQTRDDQRPVDGADPSLLAKGTPCVIGDVPIEPDTSVQAVCRALGVDGHQAAHALWAEIADSRERNARKSNDWLKLACDATVLAQTFLHEAATSADPEQAKLLRTRGERLAEHAKRYLGKVTGEETTEAVSQVKSIVAGITETSVN